MGIMDKLKGMMGQHADKAHQGTDKAGDMIDERTGGKYSDKVDMGQDKTKDYIDRQRGQDQPPPS